MRFESDVRTGVADLNISAVLTPEDIDVIDKAGAAGASSKTHTATTMIRRLAYAVLTAAAAREIFKYLNLW